MLNQSGLIVRSTFVLIIFFGFLSKIISQSQFDAFKLLDLEKSLNLPVTKFHYDILEKILKASDSVIKCNNITDTLKATEELRKISNLLKNTFEITYHPSELLHVSLENKMMDCNMYSIIIHTILNRNNQNSALILTPEHMFVRWYLNDTTWINYETTLEISMKDEDYIKIFNISKHSLDKGIYMTPLNETQAESIFLFEISMSDRINSIDKKIEIIDKLLEKDSNSYHGLLAKAYFMTLINEKEKSIYYLNKSLEIDSMNYNILNNIGNIYMELKMYDKALYYYNKSIAVNNSPSSFVARSVCWLKQGKIEEAMNDFENAKKLLNKNDFFKFLVDYHLLTYLEQMIIEEYLKQK